MRVLVLVNDSSVLKLDIEILINRVKSPSYCQVVLELHSHFSTHQVLEVREEQLHQTHKNQDPSNSNKERAREREIFWKTPIKGLQILKRSRKGNL